MSQRITQKTLDRQVEWLREIANLPESGIGAIELDCAYSSYRVVQIMTEGRGIQDLSGFMTARELYNWIRGAKSSLCLPVKVPTPDKFGIDVTAYVRDLLMYRENWPIDKAQAFADVLNTEIERQAWLSTATGLEFDLSPESRKRRK